MFRESPAPSLGGLCGAIELCLVCVVVFTFVNLRRFYAWAFATPLPSPFMLDAMLVVTMLEVAYKSVST